MRSHRLDRGLEGLVRPRCRRVLSCLADDEPQALDEVAATVAEHELGSEPATDHYEAVETDLYHIVLPKFADLGRIEYDSRSEVIRFRDSPAELEELLLLCRHLETES